MYYALTDGSAGPQTQDNSTHNDGRSTDGTQANPDEKHTNNPNEDPDMAIAQSRRIQRTANSRRNVRRKTTVREVTL